MAFWSSPTRTTLRGAIRSWCSCTVDLAPFSQTPLSTSISALICCRPSSWPLLVTWYYLPNPRGDASYGPAFRAALHADWGPGPFRDIDAGVSTLIARGLVDSTAVGIYGTSYGGYLTAFAITQTNRFAAAAIDDGPVNLESWYSQNYATMAPILRHAFDGTPWTQPNAYASQSPESGISTACGPRYSCDTGPRGDCGDNIRQSYMLAQGFELYAGLRDHGVPVEFVLHPDQGHGIVDWQLYQDWVRRNLRWFGYWLQHEGATPSLSAE